MTSIVYNGSPRHHNRIMTSGNNTPPLPSTHHLTHHNSLQQSYPFASSSVSNVAPLHTGNLIMPPPSYLSSLPSTHHHSLQLHRSSKRKSAVELLAESKPFYVKSETVLDRQQQLNIRGEILSPSRTLPTQHRPPSRRCSSSGSDLLQTKLRKLLNAGDSKEAISPDIALSANKYQGDRNKYNSYCNYQSPKITQELNVHPEAQSDVSVFFPSAFLSPQSLPPHPITDDEIYSYGIDDTLILTDDYRAISPPAEYAENVSNSQPDNCRYGYQRSYSHSQAVISDEAQYSSSYNINSHKSLPDLHAQISRHSPHSEALSCCSRGNRSNKSGSSFNRDSGGSSGHYTHRSEPCCKQKEIINTTTDYRRDSGSSTQHSGNSYYAYGIPPLRYDCMECRAKIQEEADCLLNFPTPEVPDAFKDDFNDKSRIYFEENNATTRKFYSHKNQNVSTTGEININQEPSDLSPPLGNFKRQRCLRFKNRGKLSTPASEPRCVEDDRRPILRSKSDISDRYWSKPSSNNENSKSNVEKRSKSETISQLERFFDRLGLNDDKYEEFIAPKPKPLYNSDNESDRSSAVFFSDHSTVDSNRLPDSTETNQANTNYYRPSEPPSIVERNARIIKWLCNCKKLQLV